MSQQTTTTVFGWSLLLLLSGAGCASWHSPIHGDELQAQLDAEQQFERGRPNVVIDGVGWVFGIPSRIALWNWDVANHDVSLETEAQIQEYLTANHLEDVKVRLNQYDPGGEWRRLTQNKRVSPGWRYTLGALTTVGYTILPGRVFGGDHYNPFTNTVNVYSDVASLGMVEAGYAKDVHHRSYPGTYAVVQTIPGLNLVHESLATRDVLDYVALSSDIEQQREAIHVLYPRYGGVVGGTIESFIPVGGALELGGLVAGHATGRLKTRHLQPSLVETAPALTPEESPIKTVTHEEPANDAP